MIYRCRSGSECTQTFTTERGLHIHRLACSHYKHHEAVTFAKRKALAAQKKAVVRKKGKGRAGVPGVSFPYQFYWVSDGLSRSILQIFPEPSTTSSSSGSMDVLMDSGLNDSLYMQIDGSGESSSSIHPPLAAQPPSPVFGPMHIVPSHRAAVCPTCKYRIPAHYEDIQPEGPAPLPPAPSLPPVAPGSYALPRVILHVRDSMHTVKNCFGLFREYHHRPSYDPDHSVQEDELSNHATKPADTIPTSQRESHPPPWPFQNMSIYLLMEWMITGGNQKSISEVDRLAKDVLCSKEFRLDDIADFSARKENQRFDKLAEQHEGSPFLGDGWVE